MTAAARASDPEPRITIDQAVQEALQNNLALLAERLNIPVAEARIITARLRPNPVLTTEADIINHKFFVSNSDVYQEAFRTDFLFERGAKRERRIEVAEDARSVAELNLANSIRTLVLDVESACVDVLLAKENLALQQESLKAFNSLVDVNRTRVRAGDLAQVELVRSELAALQFSNAVLQAESRLRIAKNRLQLLLGRSAASETFDLVGDLRREGAPPGLQAVIGSALTLRPDLQALRRDEARSLADIRLQLAQRKVDYTVGTEYRREHAADLAGNSVHLYFSAPIPVFNRNQGEIERARRERDQIVARIHALEATIRNDVCNAHQQYETAASLLGRIEESMLTQAREVRNTTEYSYRRGEASLIEFLDAQRAYNDTMQSYNEARAEYARSLYTIDSITGKGVNP